jgi:Protein of unknown function (DUF1573)
MNKRHYLYLIVFLFFIVRIPIEAGTSEEENLKQRVTEFYKALQANQAAKAETFVCEAAKPGFRLLPRSSVVGFRISKITPEPERNSAAVEIALKTIAPFITQTVEIPVLARWKKENGEWYYDPEDPPKTLGDKFQNCYYERKEKNVPSEVKFEREFIDFGIATQGKTLNLRFPFTNKSSKDITIEKVYVVDAYMKDASAKGSIKPGQKGEIAIDLVTSTLHLDFDTTVFVEFQPINECVRLRMKGRVFTAKELSQYTPK